jgi:hypothetical protein
MTRAAWGVIIAIVVLAALCLLFVWPKSFVYKVILIDTRMPTISADEIARAMRNGTYFAEYGRKWVVVSGLIDNIDYNSTEQVLTFKTSGDSKVRCRVQDVNLRFRKDVIVQLQAIGAHRDRTIVIFDVCRPLT